MPKLCLHRLAFVLFGFIVVLTQIGRQSITEAATTSLPLTGITVSPAYVTAQVGSAQRQASTSVGVRNNFSVPIVVTAVLNGIDIRNNALFPTNRSESVLADIIKFSPAEVTIPPQSSRNIAVIVTDKPSLAPGGHYVSLLITQSAATGQGLAPQLSLKTAVSATIYVIKEDGAIRSLAVKSLKTGGNLFSLPNAIDVTLHNDGNVANVPRGIITLKFSNSDKIIRQAVINQESVPLYPNNTTTMRSEFIKLSQPKLPGKVTARLDYRPDGQTDTKSVSVSQFYVPFSGLIGLIVFSAISGFLIWPKSRRKLVRFMRKLEKTKRKPYVPPDLSQIPKPGSKNNNLKPSK